MLLLDTELERDTSDIILQNHAISSALDEYVLKMSLGVRNGLLVVENGTLDFAYLFFYEILRGAPSASQLRIRSHVGAPAKLGQGTMNHPVPPSRGNSRVVIHARRSGNIL